MPVLACATWSRRGSQVPESARAHTQSELLCLYLCHVLSSPLRYCRLVPSETLVTPIQTLLRTHTHTHALVTTPDPGGATAYPAVVDKRTRLVNQRKTSQRGPKSSAREEKEERKKKERGDETRSAAQFIEPSRRAKLGRENRPDPPLSPLTLVASFLFFKPNLTCGPY